MKMPTGGGGNIVALFDHTVRVWRRAAATQGSMGEEPHTYVVVLEPTVANAAVRRPARAGGDVGPGLAPVGQRRLYMAAGTVLEPTDLVQLLDGPDAPQVLEVDAAPTTPRGHHVECDTRLWQGDAADLDVGS